MAADVSAVYPRLRPYAHDDATRCLCHAVHTDPFLREYVVHTVVEPHLRAVCPAFGVDLLAVARHAVQAQHRWKTHQYVFVAIRLILLADLAMAILTGWLTVAAGVLAAAVAAAFLTHFWTLRADRLAALKAVTEPSAPADQADPLPPGTETRIEALTAANVIVYAQNEFDPFIGSGRRLHWYQLNPVDITRPGRDSSGNQKVVRPFDAVSLHQYLARKVPALGFDGLRPRNRLYVQGDEVPHVPGLLPDQFAEPEPVIDSDLVKSGVQHPTEWARTYICMEQVLSGGDLVVSMYVRAWIKNGLLTIERIIYYLPPLQPRYRPTAEFAAGTALSVSITTLATAGRQFMRVLAGKRIGRLQRKQVRQDPPPGRSPRPPGDQVRCQV